MPVCIVCGARQHKGAILSFHSFPSNKELRERWTKACNLVEINLTPHTKICSKHFRFDDYDDSYWPKRKLMPLSVPAPSACYLKDKDCLKKRQPPVVPKSLIKVEPSTVFINEPPEPEIVKIGIEDILDSSEEIIPEIKSVDIVYHPICEGLIKSEIAESKHSDLMETQVLVKIEDSRFMKTEHITEIYKTEGTSDWDFNMGTDQKVVKGSHEYSNALNEHSESMETKLLVQIENSPFIKTENIPEIYKIEDTSDWDVSRGTDQEVVKAEGSHEYSNTLSNLKTEEQLAHNLSEDINCYNISSSKASVEPTSWKKDKEKIKVIQELMIPIEPHEYTSLAKDKHVCNHCQCTKKILDNLKRHIKKLHRKDTTMYQCPYCPCKSKWKHNIEDHIVRKHQDTKEILWFQCHLCEKKFKLRQQLNRHTIVHLPHKLKLCLVCGKSFKAESSLKSHMRFVHNKERRYDCDKCDYTTYNYYNLEKHKIIHLKPEEIQYLYCYHCSFKTKYKASLKSHILRHFKDGGC